VRKRFLLALACVALPSIALAWLPPSDFLLQKVADKRKSIHSMSLHGIHSYIGRSFDTGKQDVAESVWATDLGQYRIERHTPKGDQVEVSDGKRHVIVTDGKAAAIEPDPKPLERLLLAGSSKDALEAAMDAYGIHREVEGLGRLDDRICWIIGAKEGDTTNPALWIDKDRNVPLQLSDPKNKRRLRFEGWGEGPGGSVMPTRVTWYRGSDLEQELKIDDVKLNPKLTPDLFNPDVPIPPPTPTPAPKPTATPKPTPKPR
jgi:outer membrane lipoprotein-sorting protein